DFCKRRKLLVTLRSRSASSLKWLEATATRAAAVLKPSWMQMKTVNFTDVKFLGYSASDIGRLVIREPPPHDVFFNYLRSQGIEGTAEYEAAAQRYLQRYKEWHADPAKTAGQGYAQEMLEWDKKGQVRGKWNFEENAVDPNVQTNAYREYKFHVQRVHRKDPL